MIILFNFIKTIKYIIYMTFTYIHITYKYMYKYLYM